MSKILPEKSFFLFGMGNRKKLIYKDGNLISYPEYKVIHEFDVKKEEILPAEYTVILCTPDGEVRIFENENGVFIKLPDADEKCITASKIKLPDFKESKYRDLLRILHHEILINITDGLPVPNFFVYKKPWYRDSAMMAMVLNYTGNLDLITDWIKSVDSVYDENNGAKETDNIGQLMYLLSLTGEKNHPMIEACLAEAKKCAPDGVCGGTTDFAPHPVYQTKWLKFGLESLGLDASWVSVPREPESYAPLFWWAGDFIDCGKEDRNRGFDEHYPYLSWARWNYYNAEIPDDMLTVSYPLTWEAYASKADYDGIKKLSENYTKNKFAAPHTWHAAEMFLYLIEKQ